MSGIEQRITRLHLVPSGEPLYHRRAWSIAIEDESGGEFVELVFLDEDQRRIRIDPAEWPALREAIERMIAECRA